MALERINGDFASAYDSAQGKIATARQYMQERIAQGIGSDACTTGAWTSENFNCINGDIYGCLEKFNPLIPYRKEAFKAHRNSREFYLTSGVLLGNNPASKVILQIAEQDALKPAGKRRVINLGKTKTHIVPTDSFADEDAIVFLSRGKSLAKEYGLFLRNKAGIQEINFLLPLIQPQNYARSFWLYVVGPGFNSGFNGNNRSLNFVKGSVFRVCDSEGTEGAQKISGRVLAKSEIPSEMRVLPCSEEQLNSYLETAKGIKEGRLGCLQAGKLEELILKLKQFIKQ
jgi:hypothetical protein